jgi:integrase
MRMANQRKKPILTHCKVVITSHPSAPWRVSYPVEIDGVTRRKRRMFSTEQKAMDFAFEHERGVADHGVRFGSITAEARRAFDHYRDARADLLADEIEVPSFESLVMDAVANLRRDHADRQRARVTVAEAVEGFLTYKLPRVGKQRLDGLKGHLKRFARHFGTDPIDRVTGAEIEAWLGTLVSAKSSNNSLLDPVTRNKLRKNLKEFFAFGCDLERGWCHRNPLASIKPEKVEDTEPQAYTPEDAAAILTAALAMDSPALPAIALGLFAGLRPSETLATDLSTIDLSNGHFRIPAGTKTGARIATLTEPCKAWLTAQTRRSGKAWPQKLAALSPEIRRVLVAAKVAAIFDGFRHSYVTYRTAETRDVALVADECGNSPNIIKKHYREIVTGEAATKYFAIRPADPVGM